MSTKNTMNTMLLGIVFVFVVFFVLIVIAEGAVISESCSHVISVSRSNTHSYSRAIESSRSTFKLSGSTFQV